MVHAIFLIILFVLLNIVSGGAFNGMMDISAEPFQNSQISHWNATFWEKYGNGQAWRNKYENRDPYTKKRVSWTVSFLGYTVRIVKPVWLLDGWHMMKLLWRVFIAISVIPIAIICHDINGAVLASAMLYFPQVAGFYTILYFLVKKS